MRPVQGSLLRSCSVLSLVGVNLSKFEIKFFLAEFNNCISFIGSNIVKLTLLKSYLTDDALQLISHLTLEADNFHTAINLLMMKFLEVPYIKHEIFKRIWSTKTIPGRNKSRFVGIENIISDFFEENMPCFKLVSHIVFVKLLPF